MLARMREADLCIRLPYLHHRIENADIVAVEDAALDPDLLAFEARHDEIVRENLVQLVFPRRQAIGVERPDGLRWRNLQHNHCSIGVAFVPRRTISHSKPSPHSGIVVKSEKRDTIRCRAFGSTDVNIGSKSKSGSSGKYICVTRRERNDGPNSEKWMCAGRQAFS